MGRISFALPIHIIIPLLITSLLVLTFLPPSIFGTTDDGTPEPLERAATECRQ